jgi:hypothetical protein
MERHLSVDCSVMTGRSRKASSAPKCARPKCRKVLFVQIQCDVSLHDLRLALISSLLQKCRQKFCPEHRFPDSHNCSSLSSLAAPTPISSTPNRASSQISASGLAAMKRVAVTTAKSVVPSRSTKSSTDPAKATSSASAAASGSKHNISNPFSKTDR